MRWVITQPGPSWSVHDVYVGWVEALTQLGEQVTLFNFDDRLAFYDHAVVDTGTTDDAGRPMFRKMLDGEQAKELAANGLAAMLFKVRPDVLLVVSGFFLPTEILDQARRYGTRVVVLHTEQPYELAREVALAAHADLNLINDPTNLGEFAKVAPTVYAPHAYRPTIHHPGPVTPALAADLTFVGTGFPSRRWFFEQLHATGALDGRDVLLAGPWTGVTEESPLFKMLAADSPDQCCDNDEGAELYRSAKMGLNLYRREHDDGSTAAGVSMGPREVEMAACGLFFLRDPRPEGDHVLSMLPTFSGPDEAAEQIRWWLDHDDARQAVASQALVAIGPRTFTNSAIRLLGLLEQIGLRSA
jgi:spore maturation protein CgeB